MERETQVMHAIVAVGETEIDVASAELDGLHLTVIVLIATDDRRIIDGFTTFTLQDAALNPYLIGARQYWDIVKQNGVIAHICE